MVHEFLLENRGLLLEALAERHEGKRIRNPQWKGSDPNQKSPKERRAKKRINEYEYDFLHAPVDPFPCFCRVPVSGVGPVRRLETLGLDVSRHNLGGREPAGIGDREKLPAAGSAEPGIFRLQPNEAPGRGHPFLRQWQITDVPDRTLGFKGRRGRRLGANPDHQGQGSAGDPDALGQCKSLR